VFERKVYRRILNPTYEIGKENWRILTDKKCMQLLKICHNTDNKVA
jgi:hypothetical protein